MYDVGGQRNEREVGPLLRGRHGHHLCGSLSDYDQKMFEDETTNRMKDSVYLFRTCARTRRAGTRSSCS